MAEELLYYLATAVWFQDVERKEQITHLLLHPVYESTIGFGNKTTRAKIVGYLNAGWDIYTGKYNYVSGLWTRKAAITIEHVKDVAYIRTVPDKMIADNLRNLLPGWNLIG